MRLLPAVVEQRPAIGRRGIADGRDVLDCARVGGAARSQLGNARKQSMPRHCPMARPTTSATPVRPTAEAANPDRRARRAGLATGGGSGGRGPRRDEIGMMSSRESTGVPSTQGRCRTRAIPLPPRSPCLCAPYQPPGLEKCTPRPGRRTAGATRSVASRALGDRSETRKAGAASQRRPGRLSFATCRALSARPSWPRFLAALALLTSLSMSRRNCGSSTSRPFSIVLMLRVSAAIPIASVISVSVAPFELGELGVGDDAVAARDLRRDRQPDQLLVLAARARWSGSAARP